MLSIRTDDYTSSPRPRPGRGYSWQITREPDLRVGNYRNFHGNYPGVEITGNLGGLTGSRAGAASPTCVWRPSARRAEPRVRDAMLYRFLRGEDLDAEGCWGASKSKGITPSRHHHQCRRPAPASGRRRGSTSNKPSLRLWAPASRPCRSSSRAPGLAV